MSPCPRELAGDGGLCLSNHLGLVWSERLCHCSRLGYRGGIRHVGTREGVVSCGESVHL